jgi:hypothetical protein
MAQNVGQPFEFPRTPAMGGEPDAGHAGRRRLRDGAAAAAQELLGHAIQMLPYDAFGAFGTALPERLAFFIQMTA